MLDHVVSLIGQAIESQGRKLRGSKVVLLGGAYKENITEVANSPGRGLYRILEGLGAQMKRHDLHAPALKGFEVERDLAEASKGADCLVLVTAHDAYRSVDWKSLGERMNHRLLEDCRGPITEEEGREAGFHYVGLGRVGNA